MALSRMSAAALSLVAVALVATGCSSDASGSAAANDREAVRAITTAESTAGGRALHLETDDGAWEVHVASGDREVDVRVSADGGSVRSSSDAGALDAEDRAALDAASTPLADAVRIAAAQGAGAAVEDAELVRDDTTAHWSVNLSGGVTVRVSAADGSVG